MTRPIREIIASRVAQELRDGDLVNLGIGLPTLVANYIPEDVEVLFQSENGLIGMGASPAPGEEDKDLFNAGGEPVTVKPGAVFFDTSLSFAIIRGGHVDVSVLGALEVDQHGNLASWCIPGVFTPGIGGSMDLVVGAKRVIVAMEHTTKKGESKILEQCQLPLTAAGKVSLIVTELAVFEVSEQGLTLIELQPGVQLEEVRQKTAAPFQVAVEVQEKSEELKFSMSKLTTLQEAVKLIPDGALLALGGNGVHRSPASLARELARQGKKELRLIKTAGAYDVDLLCLTDSVAEVHAGYIGFEALGLAPNYRKRVEQGKVIAAEHACYSVIAALRAAQYGLPFQPIQGFQGSQLPATRGFKWITNPYGEGEVLLIPALKPDFAIIHVHEADELGNGRMYGSVFEDVLMSRAAKQVILTAERIVPTEVFQQEPEKTQIPGFLVQAVVEAPGGALPGSCLPAYPADYAALHSYLKLKADEIDAYLEEGN